MEWRSFSSRMLERLRGDRSEPEAGGESVGEPADDLLSVSQMIVRRHGRRRADALADRILRFMADSPGVTPRQLANQLNETQILVVNEVDRLVREGLLQLDRAAGTIVRLDGEHTPGQAAHDAQAEESLAERPRHNAPEDLAAEGERAIASLRGRALLAVLLIELYRRFREEPGARIEATTRSLCLVIGGRRVVEATLPASAGYLWVSTGEDAEGGRRSRIRDFAALLGVVEGLAESFRATCE